MDLSEEYFYYQARLMRILGFWSVESHQKLYKAYFIFVMAWVYSFALSQAVYTLQSLDDMAKAVNATFSFFSVASLCFQIYVFLSKRTTLSLLMENVLREKAFAWESRDQEIISRRQSRRVYLKFFILLGSSVIGILFWAVFPIVDKVEGRRVLPFKAWYPVPDEKSPYYEILYVYQIIGIIICAFIITSIDSIVLSLIAFGCSQMDTLNMEIRQAKIANRITVKCNNSRSYKKKDDEESYRLIISWIHKYQCITKFLKESERAFHMVACSQIIASVGVFCMTGLQLLFVTPASLEFVTVSVYFWAVLFQSLLFFWQGNELTITSSDLVEAVYSCQWYRLNARCNKALFIFLERLKQPIVWRAGNFFFLSLQTYVAILKTSYSYFAVLQQLRE